MAAYNSTRKYKRYKRAYDRARYAADAAGRKTNSHRWAKAHPVRYKRYKRDWNFKKLYGISLDDYETLLKKQRNRCAVCKRMHTAKRPLHVDHCHRTGRVRGLLCFSCNVALGQLGDGIKLVRNLILYLKTYMPRAKARREAESA